MARPPDPHARTRLLQAARAEFVEHGLDGAKVEHIARRAGLSKGAYYLHFASKADSFNEVIGAVMSELADIITSASTRFNAEGTRDVEAFLSQWLEADMAMFQFLLDHRDIVGLIMEGGGSGSTQHLIEEFALQTERQVAFFVKAAIGAGLYRADLNVELTAAFVAGGYDRFARRLLIDPQVQDLRGLIQELLQQVIMGIGTPALAHAATRVLNAPTTLATTESRL